MANPIIGSVSPASGPVSGGTQVTIVGQNFEPGCRVRFGRTALGGPFVAPIFKSSTQLLVTTPPQPSPGLTDVRVINPDRQSGALAKAFEYVALAQPPVITGVSPADGPVMGGTPVTILGQNFVNGCKVSFGGIEAVTTFISATSLSAISPAQNSPALVNVRVVNPDGQADTPPQGAFQYNPGVSELGSLLKEIATARALVQSPYLYLQAAGSDGSDGSVSGIHLRWDLLRSLENHFPKGNLAGGSGAPYPAPYGFNKANDFVELFRVPYVKTYPCVVDFSKTSPGSVVETGPQRLWKFDTVVASTIPESHCEVIIRFADIAQYDVIRSTVNPLNTPLAFLSQYTGVVGAEVTGKLCFMLTLRTRQLAGAQMAEATLRVEAVSVSENLTAAELFISCRKRFNGQGVPASIGLEGRVSSENVRYFRFDYTRCVPFELRLETYEHFILGTITQQATSWQTMGSAFSLTDQDFVAYERLENSVLANIHRKWPRYLTADPTSGLFTLSVPNYKAKWDPTCPPLNEPSDNNGLKKGVISYLTLSMNPANEMATASLPVQPPSPQFPQDVGAFAISYLRMLKLVALDFHVARMLGLGYIDATIGMNPAAGGSAKFVYLAVYRTTAALEPGDLSNPRTHLYMTLPTSLFNYRLPPAPVQEAPTFGITIDNGTGTPTQLTNDDGYTPFDDARIINLHLAPYDTVQAFGPFFSPPVEFCSSEVTKPVFYGCKYKLVSEADYRTPELSNDPEFSDPAGVAEVAPLVPQLAATPSLPPPPIYVHNERESGWHRYAFYGVNWFSRPSPLSNPQDVETQIPTRNTLLPPANLAVQLIQPEDPPMLTTAFEQQRLANLPASDPTLVRCTFDWNQNHYIPQRFSTANIYADKVQLYFRQEPPRAVQGKIKSVTSISDTLVEVRTQSYTLTSVSPPQTVMPTVVPGDEPRFVGSSFAVNQVLYIVDSVSQSSIAGEGAVFRLKKQFQSGVVDLNNNNQFSASTKVTTPAAGDRFLVVENMNEPVNWGANQPLAKEVTLINFLEGGQLHTETVSYPDGSQATLNIGGIQQNADITELKDVDSQGKPIPTSKTGIFEISFPSYQLTPHPDADVEWYKGTVRVPEAAGNNIKVLDIWNIDVSASTLKLTVFDPTFNVDSDYKPLSGYNPIRTGVGVPVNFHPGYRIYLKAQAGVLDQTTTLPGPTQSTKQTFLSAHSCNSALATASNLTTPVVLQARKLTPPEPPAEPVGPLFATRPDFYGKATWTMDVRVNVTNTRAPYALVFYRASERAVLDTLYDGDTANVIEAALKTLAAADATFAANRWRDLVNVQNLHSDYGFNEYTQGGYRFPIPNNKSYIIPGTNIAPFDGVNRPGDPTKKFTIDDHEVTMLDVVKSAVESVFLPLTESPLVYQFIKTGTQTSSKKPGLRDNNGELLPFTSSAFDPSPMAVKYVSNSGETLVRFTDYTLDGAAKNIYFYYAVEMSDQMKLSPRSLIAGPIHLVNAYPAEAPVIRKVTSIIEDSVLQIPTGVKLLMNAYLASEGITEFNLYRATNTSDAAAVRTMTLVRAYDAVPGAETELFDDFSDLDSPPFGDPLFYRVVALREITNERNELELIPSLPSELARASVIDVNNPVAPPLIFNSNPPSLSHPVQLTSAVVSWKKAAHNATYYLYKQDAAGNWQRIFKKKSNTNPIKVPLSLTELGTGVLLKQDASGTPIYHRFKLEVENSSGMFSLNEEVLSVPATCKEGYSFFNSVLSYADDFQAAAPLADRLFDPAVSTFPGKMTFKDIITALPTAHVFDRIEITVADGLGHAAQKAISAAGGSVTFFHGDGTGIVLDGSVVNINYSIRVRVITDSCQGGLLFTYRLQFGPQIALLDITSLLSYADSLSTTSPLPNSLVITSSPFPTTMSFTDITVLPTGHTFVEINVLLEDDAGGSFSKHIQSAHDTVTFNHGDGGLALDASAPNRTYFVTARLITDLAPDGVLFKYTISYA